jgi:Na+/H+ antiporter NhaD/arsenite permease-like protein
MVVAEDRRQHLLAMKENTMITDPKLATQALAVLGLTLVAFMFHGVFHLEPATIALFAAAVLLLISRSDPHHIFSHVEWSTIFFFVGLFMMVGAIVKVGVIGDISKFLVEATDPTAESMYLTSSVILWCSGLLSAMVDNIPYVATMSPLIQDTANSVFHGGLADSSALPLETLHNETLKPVWWSLALGSCLGGNGSPIGASANVIVIGIAARSGVKISFVEFLAYGVPVTIMSIAISHAYIWVRYY